MSNVKEKKRIIYETTDGREFVNKELAEEHQDIIDNEPEYAIDVIITVSQTYQIAFAIESECKNPSKAKMKEIVKEYFDSDYDMILRPRDALFDGWEPAGQLKILKVEKDE